MKPVAFAFRTPPGGTLTMQVILYGCDVRTGQTARLPRPGDRIEWTTEWPSGDEVLVGALGSNSLPIDSATGVITFPISAAHEAEVADALAPVPTRIRLLRPDGTAVPFLTGSVAFGDQAPMSNTSSPERLTVPSIAALPQIEPYLVGIVLSYPLGTTDLIQGDVAEAIATQLADLEDRINAKAQAIAMAAIANVMSNPYLLRDMLATVQPDTPDTPWLDNGTLAISPDA